MATKTQNALTILRDDHREVEKLFKRIEKLGPSATKTRGDLGRKLIKELSIHASVEEQLFYPALEAALPKEKRDVLKSLEAHHAAKSILAELDRMRPGNDRYEAKLLVLIDAVRDHIEEEENEIFPKVRDALSRTQLNEIGEVMARAKKTAPTKPHPHAPDTPPGTLANLAVGIVDRARTAVEEAARETSRRTEGERRRERSSAKRRSRAKATSTRKRAKSTAKKAASRAKKAASSPRKASSSRKKAASRSR